MSPAPDKTPNPAARRQRRRRARLPTAREVEFVRADWALFLHPDRLPEKAGCPRERLRAMVLKELVDNALDAGVAVAIDRLDPDTWAVADDGPGLSRDQVLRLFAVDRPLASTKLVRRPTRGALGNGLRVVTGGALASGGRLQVESRGRRYALGVDRATGATLVLEEGASDMVTGTRVTVAFGPALPRGADDGWMAQLAVRCAGPAARPLLSHPSWYDATFAELAHAAEPSTTVADLAGLMGVVLEDDRPAVMADLRDLLVHAGLPPRLLPLGADRFPGGYAKVDAAGGPPVLAEAWATAARCPPSRGRGAVTLLVNRSPVAAPVRIAPDSESRLAIWGCNLAHGLDRVSAGAAYQVVLAVTAPAVPVTTEGKEPDLEPLWPVLEPALAKAMRAAHRATRAGRRPGDIKAACREVMEAAYRKASAGGTLPANARQIYYAARPLVQQLLGPEAAPDPGPGAAVLRGYGLGEAEIEFLVRRGRRVELNAMASDQFVAWLEGKLGEHGAGKVVPGAAVLERHARRLLARRRVAARVAALVGEAEAEAALDALPGDFAARVGRELARDPALPWEDALARALADVTPGSGG